MTTPVGQASNAARLAQKALAGRSLVLRRYVNGVAQTGYVMKATVGETRADEYLESGIVTVTRFRDFFIDVGDYVINGEVTEPQMDDQIDEVIDGQTVTFQVLPAGGGPAYRHSGPTRSVWRVHAREMRIV